MCQGWRQRRNFWLAEAAADRVTPLLAGADEDAVLGLRFGAVTERPERTAQGYTPVPLPRVRQAIQRAQYPSDVTALVMLWRLRYKLSLRDLAEMFLVRGIAFSREAVRDWEAKLTPALAEEVRCRRRRHIGRSWYVDETFIKVHSHWRYLYRAIDRDGALVDVMLSERRDLPPPKRSSGLPCPTIPPQHVSVDRRRLRQLCGTVTVPGILEAA